MEDGFILAGGTSSRMGRDKTRLLFRGLTFLENAVRVLQQAGFSPRVIVSPGQKGVEASVNVIQDAVPGLGPIGGLLTALRQSRSEHAYLLPCDCPRVPPLLYQVLARHTTEFDVVVPRDSQGGLHPLCGAYARRCLPHLVEMIDGGNLQVRSLLKIPSLNVRIVPAAEFGIPDRSFDNINRQGDYERLLLDGTAF